MRNALLIFGTVLLSTAYAQEDYPKVLACDPYMSNGYFIKDLQKCRDLEVSQIDVDIIAAKPNSDGSMSKRTLQSFSITDGNYGKVDRSKLEGLEEGEHAYYHLLAENSTGGTVVDAAYDVIGGGGGGGDWLCSKSCVGATSAWTLNAYQSNTTGNVDIQLNDAANAFGYYYFFVPQSQWQTWGQAHPPGDFGLGAYEWSEWGSLHNQTEVVRLDANLAGGTGGSPIGALGWTGYALPAHTPVWGVRKDRGAYRVISASAGPYSAEGDICDILQELYNSSDDVQVDMVDHNFYNFLTCSGLPSTDGIGSLDPDGSDPFESCHNIQVGSDGNLFNWVNAVLDCIGNVGNTGGPGGGGGGGGVISEVLVNHWFCENESTVIDVQVPNEKDPKLVEVQKTELKPGLYEFLIVMNNGQMVRHFEDFDQPKVISADFADFINVNIYPVPVKDTYFAVDFDLQVPMQIDMTIVDNMGKPYYSEHLDFELPGKNKHVVKMDQQWPSGIYHAVFQYGDGSTSSRNFTVE